MKKYAVISIDVEDWYHLDYFSSLNTNRNYSMLDGLNNFLDIVDSHGISSTLFTLSSIAPLVKNELIYAANNQHEVSSHGVSHKRPLSITKDEFIEEARSSKHTLEDIVGSQVLGYRAPCFSLDNALVKVLTQVGYEYDSSAINYSGGPLDQSIDLGSFYKKMDNIYQLKSFTEFKLPTTKLMGQNIPLGGGYLRILPWLLMKQLISNFLKNNQTYFLYIHPFELSKQKAPKIDNAGFLKNSRFRYGRSHTPEKLNKLIALLKSNDFEFVTFKSLLQIANK